MASAAKVRVVGTGHSFMPLCATDGLLLSLSELEGELEVAADGRSVWCPAGMAIGKLTAALWALGFSLINQGDIDKQAIAGAVSTATHGTGRKLGSLATAAEGFRLVLADGSVVECDRTHEPELFEAARLSLGMLGVVVAIRMKVLPAYRLKETIRRQSLQQTLAEWDQLADAHRHVEFFHFPYSEHVTLKTLDVVDAGDTPPPGEFEDNVFQAVCDLAVVWPRTAPTLQRMLTRGIGRSARGRQGASSPRSAASSSRRWSTRSRRRTAPRPGAAPSPWCASSAGRSFSRSSSAPSPPTTSGSRR